MTAHEILIAAKQELLTRGWCQGEYVNCATGEVCVLGAFQSAASAGPERIMAQTLFSQAIGVDAYDFIPGWNDDPARTPVDVLQAFDRAIALAETREAVTA